MKNLDEAKRPMKIQIPIIKRALFFMACVGLASFAGLSSAAPPLQFGGCADELGLSSGARLRIYNLNGVEFTATAIGIDGFDPEITVIDGNDEVVMCSDNSREAEDAFANLPTATAPASPNTASVRVKVPGSSEQLDYDLIVTSADRSNGEFVLLFDGAQIYGASEIDRFTIFTNAEQAKQEVPLGVYIANTDRPDWLFDPVLTFTHGENFEQICYKSSSRAFCDGDSQDLFGYDVKLIGDPPDLLTGNDVMLFYETGSFATEYDVQVSAYQEASYGPYTFILHSAVGYPTVLAP